MQLSDTEIALIGTFVGSIGLAVVNRLISTKDRKQDHGTQIREELRAEVIGLRDQLAQAREIEQGLEAEVEEWRGKLYDLRDEDIKRQTELIMANERLRVASEHVLELQQLVAEYKTKVDELEKKIKDLEAKDK